MQDNKDLARKAAEQAYAVRAFDYPSNPVGSRDWTLFWAGFQAAEAVQPTELAELQKENDRLRAALGDSAMAATMLHELHVKDGGINAVYSGGAAQLLAESLGQQFIESGAENYLEVGFNTSTGVRLLVTLQRCDGKTPATLRREAEEMLVKALTELEQLRAAGAAKGGDTQGESVAPTPSDSASVDTAELNKLAAVFIACVQREQVSAGKVAWQTIIAHIESLISARVAETRKDALETVVAWHEQMKASTSGSRAAHVHHESAGAVRAMIHSLASPAATVLDGTDRQEDERTRLRAEQAAAVMPIIGPMLDAFDNMPNDFLSEFIEEASDLYRHIKNISAAMIDDSRDMPAHSPATGSKEGGE